MPIYEYSCSNCQKILEIMQKHTDSPPSHCTHCGKGPLEKLISRTSFQLKGQGWYATDYKKPPTATPNHTSDSSGKAEKKSPNESSTPAKSNGAKKDN